MIDLGDRVREEISGYTGIVVGRTEYLWGCLTYWVKAEGLDNHGKPHKGHWFDEDRLNVVEVNGKPVRSITGGPDRPVPSARRPAP